MDPIEVIVADVAKSTLTGCAKDLVGELAELVGGTWRSAERVAAEDAVTGCLSVFLQVRASADFGAISAKSLREFGRALGEFAGHADVRGQLMSPYRDDDCDPAPVVAELERLWHANQEDLRLPQLPAGYWARAFAEYVAAADEVLPRNPLLGRGCGLNAPPRLAVLPEALQLLEQRIAADANPRRPDK